MLNFSELQTAVAELMERSDNNMITRIQSFLNAGYRTLNDKRPWMSLLRQQTFQSVANVDYFITGQEVEQVIDLSQRETPLIIALQRYFSILSKNFDAMNLNTGNPVQAAPMGEIGVLRALSADTAIGISSSAITDVTQNVRIHGYSSTTKMPITEVLALNGQNFVTSVNTYSKDEGFEPRFSKDSDTDGIITIVDNAGSATIAQLAPTEREARYKKWKVWPAFQSSQTIYMTYKKRIYKMVNAEDTPEIECDNALIQYAFASCLREKRQIAKAKEIFGIVDANGHYPPGTFMAEVDALIAKEPQFSENFTDQFIPIVDKAPIDTQEGQIGSMLWPRGN